MTAPGLRFAPTALLASVVIACGLPPVARPGQTLRPGEYVVGGFLGGTFGSEQQPDGLIETTGNFGVFARAGLFERCDANAELSVMRAGLHARCSVVSERAGAPFSLSPGAGVAFLPGRGPEALVALDVGAGAGGLFSPLLNLELSRGTYFRYERRTPEELGHDERSGYRRLTRLETRLRTTLGFSVRAPTTSGPDVSVTFGASPYWILAGGERARHLVEGVTWSAAVGGVL